MIGMTLDIRTMLFLLPPLCGGLSIALFFVWRVHSNIKGLLSWAIGMGLIAGGYSLMSLRGIISPLLSINFSNTLIFAGYVLFIRGIRDLRDMKRGGAWEWGVVAIAFLSSLYFNYVRFDLNARIITYSAASALLMFRCSFLFLADATIGRRGAHLFTALSFFVLAIYLSFRIVWTFIDAGSVAPDTSFLSPNAITEATIFLHVLVYPLLAIGLVILPGERVQTELADEINTRIAAEKNALHMARHDPLTKLPNRRLFDELGVLTLAAVRRNKRRLSVLFIDIDGFKAVNDTFGHEGGDQLLQMIAERLTMCVREMDVVARLGGDEFVILLAGQHDIAGPQMVAANIVTTIAESFEIDGGEARIGASIGIALYPDHGATIDELVKHSDSAMYIAKEKGKNGWQIFKPE